MSELAWKMLYILLLRRPFNIASWSLGKHAGGSTTSIQSFLDFIESPEAQTPYEQALLELIDKGLVREVAQAGDYWELDPRNERAREVWGILTILLKLKLEDKVHYLAGWTLGERLGQSASAIQGAHVKWYPENEYEAAMKELVELGLVEEMPDLGERWRLIVKKGPSELVTS